MSGRVTKRQTVVLSERDVPAGCVTSAHWKGQRTPKDTDAQKLIQNSVYKGKMDYFVVYPDGRQVRNPDYWVNKLEADAIIAAAVEPTQASTPTTPPAKTPPPPVPPVVNNQLVTALESIAGSLEIIAEVALSHDRSSPALRESIVRQPSMNGNSNGRYLVGQKPFDNLHTPSPDSHTEDTE